MLKNYFQIFQIKINRTITENSLMGYETSTLSCRQNPKTNFSKLPNYFKFIHGRIYAADS